MALAKSRMVQLGCVLLPGWPSLLLVDLVVYTCVCVLFPLNALRRLFIHSRYGTNLPMEKQVSAKQDGNFSTPYHTS